MDELKWGGALAKITRVAGWRSRCALALALMFLGLGGGCGGDTYQIAGVSQKGPFINGSTVTIQELDDSLEPTGVTFSTQTTNDLGAFSLGAELGSPYAEVIIDGFFFDEIIGATSPASIVLRTVVDLEQASQVNVNVLTSLQTLRLRTLVAGGASFAGAQAQAQAEVLAAFNIVEPNLAAFHEMDISQAGAAHAVLLAVSAVLMQMAHDDRGASTNPAAALASILPAIATDLQSDGVLSSVSTQGQIRSSSMRLDLAAVRANLELRLDQLGIAATAPAFEDYVDSDGDGILNKDDTPYGAMVAEGSLTAPKALGAVDLVGEHLASVDTTMSYYVVTDVGAEWIVTVREPSDDVDLYVYGSADFSSDLVCSSTLAGAVQEECLLGGDGSSPRYIAIDGSKTSEGALFKLGFDP